MTNIVETSSLTSPDTQNMSVTWVPDSEPILTYVFLRWVVFGEHSFSLLRALFNANHSDP